MAERFLTTGEAARICSVTRDTIFKWIRSGYLPARRTAGGHHRIDRKDLEKVLKSSSSEPIDDGNNERERAFKYCWEYHGQGKVTPECLECSVFKMRAQRCFEVIRLAPEAQHLMLFCEASCSDCEYFQESVELVTNVLLVTEDADLEQKFSTNKLDFGITLKTANSAYQCAAILSDFHPDFVIVDSSLGKDKVDDIVQHISADPRIPLVRIVIAGEELDFPDHCEKVVFARIRKPFSEKDITDCIIQTGLFKEKNIENC
jgi:excisionase family DNA binding protein